jgi:Pectate lyase superfamily protein
VAVEVYADQPLGTVVSGGTDAPPAGTQETLTVVASMPFASASSTANPPTQFHFADIAAQSETMLATNTAGNTWTVTRGTEGTVPVLHAPGFQITQVVTAGALSALTAAAYGAPGWYNVRSPAYGATGNGTTDDTAAIQAALNACSSITNGGIVYLPPGNYLVNGSAGLGLTIPSNVCLAGGVTDINLSMNIPAFCNLQIGSNSLTGFLCPTGKSVTFGGFSVTAANAGCTVPVIYSGAGYPAQYWHHIYASSVGGVYMPGVNRSLIEWVSLNGCTTGYGFFQAGGDLNTFKDSGTGPSAQTYGNLSGVTLTAQLTSGTVYTSLAVTALSSGLTAGQVLVVGTLNNNVQPVVVAAAASSGATSVTVMSFTANNTYAIGSVVQQYTMGFVSSGTTTKMEVAGVGSGYAWPFFLYNNADSTFIDCETNESGQNGIDAMFINAVSTSQFFGFNNNTGSFNGFMLNISNASHQLTFTGGYLGGGGTGIINLDGTNNGQIYDIAVTGTILRCSPSQSGPAVPIVGNVARVAIAGNTWYADSVNQALISDAGTNAARGNVYAGNAISGIPGGLTVPIVVTGTAPQLVTAVGNTGCPDLGARSFAGPLAETPVVLTDASSVAVNAAAGNFFTLLTTSAVGSSRTLANPTNLTPGQRLTFRVTQPASGGPCALSFGTAYNFGTGIPTPALTAAASEWDYLTFFYNEASSVLDFVGFANGF